MVTAHSCKPHRALNQAASEQLNVILGGYGISQNLISITARFQRYDLFQQGLRVAILLGVGENPPGFGTSDMPN